MFEQRILELCARGGVDQTKLSTDAGFSTDTVSNWIRKARSGTLNRTGKMDQLAKHYGVTTDWLFGETEQAPAADSDDAKRWMVLVQLHEDGGYDLNEAVEMLATTEFDRSRGPVDAMHYYRLVKKRLQRKHS